MAPAQVVAKFVEGSVASSVSHQDGELATTISFNLNEGVTLGARAKPPSRSRPKANIGMLPINVRGELPAARPLSRRSSPQGQPGRC